MKIRGRHRLSTGKVRCRRMTEEGVPLDYQGTKRRPLWLEHMSQERDGTDTRKVGKGYIMLWLVSHGEDFGFC